jgi:hypothetical protein
VREIFPASIVARVDAAAPTAEDVDPVSSRATRKDDKSRKKSDKRKPTLPTMPVPQAAAPQPPAPPTPAEPREPVQDEWGLFDPNRCGFAALVDKLNEVTDEKDQKPPTKTTVRVISYG